MVVVVVVGGVVTSNGTAALPPLSVATIEYVPGAVLGILTPTVKLGPVVWARTAPELLFHLTETASA